MPELHVGTPFTMAGIQAPQVDAYLRHGPAYVGPDANHPYTYLSSGPVTVTDDLVDAAQRQGGYGHYSANTRVLVGGVDVTEYVSSDLSWAERMEDAYTRMTIRLRGDQFHYLDRAAFDAGESFQVIRYMLGASGRLYEVPLFTGFVRSGAVGIGYKRLESVMEVSSEAARWDNVEVQATLSVEASPYNCVVFGVGGECEIVPTTPPSADSVVLRSGQVLIDRGFGGGTNIVTVDIAEQTLHLPSLGITLSGESGPGSKSIFIANNGAPAGSDEGPPANAVSLAEIEIRAEGEVISKSNIGPTRIVSVPEHLRYRAAIARIMLEAAGFDTSTVVFPSVNDDKINTNVVIPKRKILDWLRQWFRPSRWRFFFDPSGRMQIYVDTIDYGTFGHQWQYHSGNCQMLDWSGPEKGNAPTSVTVRGVKVINHGLRVRREYTESRSYSRWQPVGDDEKTTRMGGYIQPYSGADAGSMRLDAKIREYRSYVGTSLLKIDRKEYRLINPLNIKDGLVPKSSWLYPNALPEPFRSSTASWAAERAFGHASSMLYLAKTGQYTEVHWYRGRVKFGMDSYDKKLVNNPVSGAVPMTNPDPPFDTANVGIGLGYRDTVGYGFEGEEPSMQTVAITNERQKVGVAGFLRESERKEYVAYNPHWAAEQGFGSIDIAASPVGAAKIHGFAGHPWGLSKMMMLANKTLKSWRKLRSNPKLIKVETLQMAFRKDPTGLGNTGMRGSVGDIALGATQSVASSKESTTEIIMGSPPAAESLADDIERWECFATLVHPLAEAQLGDGVTVDEDVPYVEESYMAVRVAQEIMGRGLCDQVLIQAPLNPLIRRFQTILINYTTPEGRHYLVRARLIGESWTVGLKPSDPDGMSLICEVDFQQVYGPKATRT